MGANCCAGQDATTTSQPKQAGKGDSAGDQKIRKAVKTVFKKYDKDNSGLLDRQQVFIVINAALNQMQAGRTATKDQVQKMVIKCDLNKDGKVSQEELFKLFKAVAQY